MTLSGERVTIPIPIEKRNLMHYHAHEKRWLLDTGDYTFHIGGNLNHLPLTHTITITDEMAGSDSARSAVIQSPALKAFYENTFYRDITCRHPMFEKLNQRMLPSISQKAARPYTPANTIEDIEHTFIGKLISLYAEKVARDVTQKEPEQEGMMRAMIYEMPFFAMVASGDGMLSETMMYGLLDLLNGNYISGMKKLIRGQ